MFVNNGIHFIPTRCAYDYICSWYKILADNIFQTSLDFLKFSDSLFLLCYIDGVCKVFQQRKKTFSIVHSFSCFQNERYEFLIMTYIFRICLNLSWFKHFFKSMHSLTYLRFVYLFFFVPSTRIYQSDRIQRLNFKASC